MAKVAPGAAGFSDMSAVESGEGSAALAPHHHRQSILHAMWHRHKGDPARQRKIKQLLDETDTDHDGNFSPLEVEHLVSDLVDARRSARKYKTILCVAGVLFIVGALTVLCMAYVAGVWANKASKETQVGDGGTLQQVGHDGGSGQDIQTARKVYLVDIHSISPSTVRNINSMDVTDGQGMLLHLDLVGFGQNTTAAAPNLVLYLAMGYRVDIVAPSSGLWEDATWTVRTPSGGSQVIRDAGSSRRRRLDASSSNAGFGLSLELVTQASPQTSASLWDPSGGSTWGGGSSWPPTGVSYP